MQKEWFGEWFNSPYYHVLYKNRDQAEAQKFIDNLTKYLKVSAEHQLMDLACGKGRHAIYLNKQGFQVTGLDLSEENIKYARQFENNKLHFEVHDMRLPYQHQKFDFIFNLFTSFGYFDTHHEHEVAIKSVARALKPKGKLILDFFNTYKVINNLKPQETKKVDDIEFNISKQLSEDGYIIKDIRFNYNDKNHHFTEKVKAIKKIDFLEFFKLAELEVIKIFGDYDLAPYLPGDSERMIFEVKKS